MKVRALTTLSILCALSGAASAGTGYVTGEAGATTTLKGKADRYAAWRALDGDLATGWCEGAKTEGVGETLVIGFNRPQVIRRIQVFAGFQKSAKLYKANNRPTVLEITTDGGATTQAMSEGLFANLVEEGLSTDPTASLSLGFSEVVKGKVNDTCISEVVITTDEGVVTLVDENENGSLMAAVSEINETMKACDAGLLGKLAKFPLKKSFAWRESFTIETKPKAKTYKKAAALAKDCAAISLSYGDNSPRVLNGVGKDTLRVMAEDSDSTALDFKLTAKGWILVQIVEYLAPD